MKLFNPVAAVSAFFARRKLIYLGSADMESQQCSPILGRSWVETEHIEFYASESGKRVIKGMSKGDIPKLLATSTVLANWYRDKETDPFSLIPPNPSKFSQQRTQHMQGKVVYG